MIINKEFILPESLNKEQTHTLSIDKLKSVKSIEVNNGKVELVKAGDGKVTFKVSGGSYTRKEQTGGSYIPEDTKEVTGETSANYDKDGYKGTLERYLYSGSYTPSDTKYVTGQTSSYYNSGGYTGTLERYLYSGSYTPSDTKYVTGQSSANYNSGGYTGTLTRYQAGTKTEKSRRNILETRGSDPVVQLGSHYDDISFVHFRVYRYEPSNTLYLLIQAGGTLPEINDAGGQNSRSATTSELTHDERLGSFELEYKYWVYPDGASVSETISGTIKDDFSNLPSSGSPEIYIRDVSPPITMRNNHNSRYESLIRVYMVSEKEVPVYKYQGNVTKPASDTRVYRYRGNVTKPASDTRVYRYRGKVTRPESDTRTYDYYYQYKVSIDYTDNDPPKISGTDIDMGDIVKELTYSYTVTDEEKDLMEIRETLNGTLLNSYKNVTSGTKKTITLDKATIYGLKLNVKNTLKIEVSDEYGKSTRIVTFTRINNAPVIELNPINFLDGYSNTGKFEITGSVSDKDGDDFDVFYKLNSNKDIMIKSDTKKDRDISIIINVGDLHDGENIITISAEDKEGQISKKVVKLNKAIEQVPVNFGIRTYKLEPEEEMNGVLIWVQKNKISEAEVEISVNGEDFFKLQRNIINTPLEGGGYEDEYIYYEDKNINDMKLRISTKDDLVITNINGAYVQTIKE